ncbi:WXG100 family type VII secretion target [Pseudobutyrivibrio sp. 49]|uniref:WXG100 family type VII secretion target n=1 Tax=Pseudobutyrivibrio sp. 49 TaxID=1855344 RepID=UPI0008824C90|nr:WXG100 family type VII secretion target [Pseudobutyrivibrio sp. 49]SDI36189.1 WXG100 family type VII secretion target [Pseudobutyrivibrio sp. 49]
MGQIRITPEELREAANFLQQKQEAINSEVSELKSKVDEVTGNWEGAAQSQFVESFLSDMYPMLHETMPQIIEGIASQMNGAADAIEQADQEVANAFKG